MPTAVLLTKHQKANAIAPVLNPLGFIVEEYSEFDTDSLGTFSGEIERTLSPKDCALEKAKRACELTGCDIGLGSEGSFGGGPMPGFMNWNSEIICFYQKPSDTAIFAFAEGPTKADNLKANNLEELCTKANRLPGQYWIYRGEQKLFKGLSPGAFPQMTAAGELQYPVKLEPDLRAMHCPERQGMIKKAAEDLAKRLLSPCPKCQAVDFVVKATEKGLPCHACHLPTNSIRYRIKRCDNCGYEEKVHVEQQFADAATCSFCNP